MHSASMLRRYCLEWISKHASEVLETESFKALSKANPQLVVEILRVKAETTKVPGMKRKRTNSDDQDQDTKKRRRAGTDS